MPLFVYRALLHIWASSRVFSLQQKNVTYFMNLQSFEAK